MLRIFKVKEQIMNTPLPDEYDLDIFKREEAELFNGKDLTLFDCDDPYFN